ncbi:adenylyltransferase/cytidyltransferase family protein [Acinetobacter qingfengensis]|uniref:Pantothenate synthetase n=1 Tax=Acinetobacter qingfengensis TaxID=1262585 RepID=A0A1E7R5S0_9GAMM|nr:pantoate--beta-alanine ligase [Acinetobacter qingfengensis]KAA8735699.1 adenylyltransferase/cytidyltransferase family protein [Acinetobacter qingfengensis]OEY94627.1 pantoate--beta-alanine ligase [Acinetobacter qingfengensis]
MKTETTILGLDAALKSARLARKSIGLISAKGRLHQGHLSIIREARKLCDVVVVSIFVNPARFNAVQDYANYCSILSNDHYLLADMGCDLLFVPTVQQLYGDDLCRTKITVPGITDILCGQFHYGYFDDDITTLTKLFNIVQPGLAFLGQIDWQKIEIMRAIRRDLNLPVAIVAVPIFRDENGVVLSRCNTEFNDQQRRLAPLVYQSLLKAQQNLYAGQRLSCVLEEIYQTLQQSGFEIEYVQAYTPYLEPVIKFDQNIMLFVAVKLGIFRLKDNINVKYPS